MFTFFRCIAEAVVEKGFRGLAEIVPGGGYVCDIAVAVWLNYREKRRLDEVRAEIQELAQSNFDEARTAAATAVAEVAPDAPIEDRINLELFLSQVPCAVRASLKRPEDVSGRSVPASFALNSAEDVERLLPGRPPRFRPGDAVVGLAGWELVEPLGAGGFGEVWLARHRSMSALSGAVKFCHGQQARDLKHESGLINCVMAAGRHPNIVPLTNVYLEGDAPWLMYEYVPGGDLADRIREWQAIDPADRVKQAITAFRELADAVGFFHKLSPPVVHRDLKPSNILFDRTTGKFRITDFGIGGVMSKAKLAEEVRGQTSHTGRLASYLRGSHTPLYASPQQRDGSPPDPRDDVHSLGVIGYQMLTGNLHLGAGPDFADDLRDANVPEDLITLLGRCVAQKVERRPATAIELAAWRPAPPPIPKPAEPASPPTTTTRPVPAEPPPPPPIQLVPQVVGDHMVQCPECQKKLRIGAHLADQDGTCPSCGTGLHFPPVAALAVPEVVEEPPQPLPPPPPQLSSTRVPVSTGTASVTLRRSMSPMAVLMTAFVELDGEEIAQLSAGSTKSVKVDPGEYELRVRMWGAKSRHITVKFAPGRNYAFVVTPSFWGGFNIDPE